MKDLLTQTQRDKLIEVVFERFQYGSGLSLLEAAAPGVESEVLLGFIDDMWNEVATWSCN